MPTKSKALKNRSAIDNRYSLTDIHIDDSVAPGRRRYGLWKVPAITNLPELPLKQGTFSRYTVTASDIGRIDMIAYRVYGDVSLWWAVAVYNRIANPLADLEIGQVLLLPNKNLIVRAIEQARVYT